MRYAALGHASPALPPYEEQRLSRLAEYEASVLQQPAERLHSIVMAAAAFLTAPIAALSLVGRDKQRLVACVGLEARETDHDDSFCGHAIAQAGDAFVVPDARVDWRFATNPLVTGGMGVCFYAAAPLRTFDNFNIGALCVIDTRPRPEGLCESHRRVLQGLADAAMDRLKLH